MLTRRVRIRAMCRQRRAHTASLVDIQPSEGLGGDAATFNCANRVAGIWTMPRIRGPWSESTCDGDTAAGAAAAATSVCVEYTALGSSTTMNSGKSFNWAPTSPLLIGVLSVDLRVRLSIAALGPLLFAISVNFVCLAHALSTAPSVNASAAICSM